MRQQHGEKQNRADIKDDQAENDGADCAGHDLARVFGFTRCRADQLDRGIGEDDALYDHERGQDAVGEEAATLTNEMEAGLMAVNRCAGHDEVNADS